MGFLPDSILTRLGKKYKASSLRTIDGHIKRVFVGVFNTDVWIDDILIKRYDDVVKWLEGLKPSVKKSIANSLRVVMIGSKRYERLFKEMIKKYKSVDQWKIPDAGKFISLEEIGNMLEMYDMRKHGNAIKKIVLGLYIYLPPLRGQDFYTAVVKMGKGDNTLDVLDWNLRVADYKTAKKYGVRVLNIPRELRSLLRKWFEFRGGIDAVIDQPLLINRNGDPYTQDAFTHLLWRIFGDNFSVDMLRRVYISEMVKWIIANLDGKNVVKWRKRLAYLVGHSIESQEFIYSNHKLLDNIKMSNNEYMQVMFDVLRRI